MRPVWIVCQDRTASRGAATCNGPVVRPDRGGAISHFCEEGLRFERGALLAGSRKGHVASGEIIIVQDLGLDGARIEPLRHLGGPLRLKQPPETINLDPCRACDPGPCYLGRDIAGEPVAADAHHVLGPPQIRHRARNPELDGERLPTGPDVLYEGVDASNEGFGVALSVR